MKIEIGEINKNELLRYLGYNGQELDTALENKISQVCEKVLEAATPRVTYKEDEREIVFGATLGARVDSLIHMLQVKDMASAVIADAAGSTLIEQVCDEFENQMRGKCNLSPRFSPGYGDFPLTAQREILSYLNAERQIGLTLTSGGMLSPIKSVTAVMRKIYDASGSPAKTTTGVSTSDASDAQGAGDTQGACDAQDSATDTLATHERGCGNCTLKDNCKFRK